MLNGANPTFLQNCSLYFATHYELKTMQKVHLMQFELQAKHFALQHIFAILLNALCCRTEYDG